MTRTSTTSAAVLSVLLFAAATSSPIAAQTEDAAIISLIANLDSDQFDLRDAATRQLILLGPPAVECLKKAAMEGSAEVTWRAVFAIGEIAVAGDFDKRNIAEEMLDKLKTSGNLSAAARAQTILETLPDSRQTRAIDMIRSLGGIIDISGTQLQINDKWTGNDSGLRYVRHVAALRYVQIEPSAPVSDEGVQKLRDSLPVGVRITQFGNAFLGVGAGSIDDVPGMMVLTVQPDSPAAKGGLQEGDCITKIDENKVNNFDDLVATIRKKKVGDVVAIEYTRPDPDTGEARPAKTKVTLGARPGTPVAK